MLRPFESEINARVSHLLELVLDANHCSGYTVARMEGLQAKFHFGKPVDFGVPRGTPSPLRSIGIIDLAENRNVIYGGQQLRGKILSRKDLSPIGRFLLAPLSLWL